MIGLQGERFRRQAFQHRTYVPILCGRNATTGARIWGASARAEQAPRQWARGMLRTTRPADETISGTVERAETLVEGRSAPRSRQPGRSASASPRRVPFWPNGRTGRGAEDQPLLRDHHHDVLGRAPPLPAALPRALRRVQGIDRHRGQIIVGSLPKRALRLVRAWAELHADELDADWQRVVNKEPLASIDPLL